jgi:hypothetical protein
MKKLFLALVASFLLAGFQSSLAQPKIGFGVKAGINISNQTTKDESQNVESIDLKGIIRFNAGAWFNYFIFDKLAIQPEILISGKGTDWNDPNYNVKDLLTYIDIPVLLKFQPIDLLNIHAGPQFGYLLLANQKDNETGDVLKINDYYKKSDLGLVVGIEANLPFKISLNARYVFGLVTASSEVMYIDPWVNNFFQISVGYRFMGK